MTRTVIWFIHFAISLIGTLPALYRLKRRRGKMEPEVFTRAAHERVMKWARAQIKWSGARVQVEGAERIPEGPVLFVSNHQGNFDVACFLGLIDKPKGYISKTEILSIPIVRTWMTYIDCVFMDRSDMRKSARAITDGINILKAGGSLVIFPEGTRSKGGPVGEFKAGSFKLATKSQCPIVPVTMDGTFRLMEEKNRITPADMRVIIHPPVMTEGLSAAEAARLPEHVRDIIISALDDINGGAL